MQGQAGGSASQLENLSLSDPSIQSLHKSVHGKFPSPENNGQYAGMLLKASRLVGSLLLWEILTHAKVGSGI